MEPFSLVTYAIGIALGGIVGNRSDHYLCLAIRHAVDGLKAAGVPANHDLQKGVRKAYLQATIVVCDSCVADSGVRLGKLFSSFIGNKSSDDETKLLIEISRHLHSELHLLPQSSYEPPTEVTIRQITSLLEPKGASGAERMHELRLTLQQGLIDEITAVVNRSSDSPLGLSSKREPPQILQQKISGGWVDQRAHVHTDWFELFCAFFVHEIKNNQALRAVLHGQLLAQLSIEDNAITLTDFQSHYESLSGTVYERLDQISHQMTVSRAAQAESLAALHERFDEMLPHLILIPEIERQNKAVNHEVLISLRELRRQPFFKKYTGSESADRINAIVAEHTRLFVGRENEFAEVESYIEENASGRLMLIGQAGFGKTAFLANWLKRLQESRSCFVAYHFFNQRENATRSLRSAYANLLRQLCIYYEVSDQDLPSDETQLRETIYGLIQERGAYAEEPLIIVIDALDEAESVFSPPFPTKLPDGVFIVVSGRASDDEVPAYFRGWDEGARRVILSRLPLWAIAEWLRRTGSAELTSFADDEVFILKLDNTTQGFPLYLHFLIDELSRTAKAGLDVLKVLNRTPKGFRAYISDQLQLLAHSESLLKRAGVQKLFALLSVTLGPISERDVRQLTGLTFWELRALPWQVTRWFKFREESSTNTLYSFSHTLLASEFQFALGYEAKEAQSLLLAYCANWFSNSSHYSFRYYAEHLHQSGAHEPLFALARNKEFRRLQEINVTEIPTIGLRTLELAGLSAFDMEDGVAVAEFLLDYAHSLARIRCESPLEGLRRFNIDRAWALAELSDRRYRVLYYLMIAWMCNRTGNMADAQRTMAKLSRLDSPQLLAWEGELAVVLLENLLGIDSERWMEISNKLLPAPSRKVLQKHLVKNEELDGIAYVESETVRKESQSRNANASETKSYGNTAGVDIQEPSYSKSDEDEPGIAIALEPRVPHSTADKVEVAIRKAMLIAEDSGRVKGLVDIASRELLAGKKESALAAFSAAMMVAKSIADRYLRASALATIARRLIQADETRGAKILFDSSLRIIQPLRDDLKKQFLLKTIANGQALLGEPDQALSTVGLMWRENRPSVLSKLALLRAKVGRLEEAKEMLKEASQQTEGVKGYASRCTIVLSIAKAWAQIGDTEKSLSLLQQAVAIVQEIKDPANRASAMMIVAEEQSKVGDQELSATLFDTALMIIEAIENPQRRLSLTLKIIKRLVNATRFSLAISVAMQIESPASRVRSLTKIARGQVAALQVEQSRQSFDLATSSAVEVQGRLEKVKLLKMIGVAQYKANQTNDGLKTLEMATKIALEIPDEITRAQTLLVIVASQISIDDFAGAALTVKAIGADSTKTLGYRMTGVSRIARKQAQLGLWEDAVRTIEAHLVSLETVRWEWSRAWALGNVARMEFCKGKTADASKTLAEAMKCTELIREKERRVATQASIAAMIANGGACEMANSVFSRAVEISKTIETAGDRAWALANVGTMQLHAGKKTEGQGHLAAAIQTARSISDRHERANILVRIAEMQASAGERLASKDTLVEALEAARTSRRRVSLIKIIAESLVRIGFVDEGRALGIEIEDGWDWGKALELISQTQKEDSGTLPNFNEPLQAARSISQLRRRDWVLRKIADLQAKSGLGDQALQTLESVLTLRSSAITDIAKVFVENADKVNFKQLLIPSASYLDAAYRMCGLIARLFPERSTALSHLLLSFEADSPKV